ncbi:hypothetical protein J26TS2_09060 [Shouchella clausii]|nr:hypothetical protein J26TS2_09060 [Shouchella clausii]
MFLRKLARSATNVQDSKNRNDCCPVYNTAKENARYLKGRSAARSFIRNRATKEDLDELEQLIAERRKRL